MLGPHFGLEESRALNIFLTAGPSGGFGCSLVVCAETLLIPLVSDFAECLSIA